MQQIINITFHNLGLRSYIEVDLCLNCPRQDDKGCCGHYSPIFYPVDFALWLEENPQLIEEILGLPNLTFLDASITVNSPWDGNGHRCPLHSVESGCRIPQRYRESVCRHFVCSGIAWQDESALKPWFDFFEDLSAYEIDLNTRVTNFLALENLSLRSADKRQDFFSRLKYHMSELTKHEPAFFTAMPTSESISIVRELKFGNAWTL